MVVQASPTAAPADLVPTYIPTPAGRASHGADAVVAARITAQLNERKVRTGLCAVFSFLRENDGQNRGELAIWSKNQTKTCIL